MGGASYYFTLYKKLQVMGHVPAGTNHGAGVGGFNLGDPHAVFGSSDAGSLLAASANPADNPLWAVLNSRAMGNDGFTTVVVNGEPWPTMPVGTGMSPASWAEFQINAPAPKLVSVLGEWIAGGKIDDVPDQVLGQVPPTLKRLANGCIPYACNMPGDDGVAPVPSNYWATSLIFLVNPSNGNTVSPSHLSAGEEYFLTAVIGNRGEQRGGRYSVPQGPGIESEAHVMVWNTGMSPAVKLPALSNLDITSSAAKYESYFLPAGGFDVVGFRLPVQKVFDALVAAVGRAGLDRQELGRLRRLGPGAQHRGRAGARVPTARGDTAVARAWRLRRQAGGDPGRGHSRRHPDRGLEQGPVRANFIPDIPSTPSDASRAEDSSAKSSPGQTRRRRPPDRFRADLLGDELGQAGVDRQADILQAIGEIRPRVAFSGSGLVTPGLGLAEPVGAVHRPHQHRAAALVDHQRRAAVALLVEQRLDRCQPGVDVVGRRREMPECPAGAGRRTNLPRA